MEENIQESVFTLDDINKQVEEQITQICNCGLTNDNLNELYKLVDIHKDIANEHYWKTKEEYYMMYRAGGSYNEGNYGRGSYNRGGYGEYGEYGEGGNYNEGGSYGRRGRDSRGRFTEGGSYGRRYRGHDMIEEMADHYGNYMEGRSNGMYGGPEINKALDYMLKSVEEFMRSLKEDASSQEEVEKIKRTARKISDM